VAILCKIYFLDYYVWQYKNFSSLTIYVP